MKRRVGLGSCTVAGAGLFDIVRTNCAAVSFYCVGGVPPFFTLPAADILDSEQHRGRVRKAPDLIAQSVWTLYLIQEPLPGSLVDGRKVAGACTQSEA